MGKLIACLVVAFASTAFADRRTPAGPTAGDTLAGDILVWADAKLYTEASTSAQSIQLFTFGGKPRKDMVGYVTAWRPLRPNGEFVEVMPTSEDCTWLRFDHLPIGLARIHLFVRRADIAPAVIRHVAKTFDDGTSFTLESGVPVVPDGDGYAVSYSGDIVKLPIAAKDVGYAYGAPRGDAPVSDIERARRTGAPLVALARGTVTLGGSAMTIRDAPIPHVAPSPRSDARLFSLEAACMTATVVAPASQVRAFQLPDDPNDKNILTKLYDGGWFASEGTALLSKTGHTVAVADTDVPFGSDIPAGSRVCHDFTIEARWIDRTATQPQRGSSTLSLCVARGRLSEHESQFKVLGR